MNTDIEKSEQVIRDLREATREARECLKDFLAMHREYKKLSDSWQVKAEKLMAEAAEKSMKHFFDCVDKAIVEATDTTYRRFDKLANIMMGEENDGQESLTELAKKKVAREKRIRGEH